MSQNDRDRLKVMSGVLKGDRSQVEAARLLSLDVRQIYRIKKRLEDEGDTGVIHRLRGRPSNARVDGKVREKAVAKYRARYVGCGPTFASEKLLLREKISVQARTLRNWLLAEGLWSPTRRRQKHRSRRERRACFGEMVQADASEHDWLEGRGPMLTLVGMIDDATDKVVARFHPTETTESYMDVLGRWIERYGRPVSWYTDCHGIFRAEANVPGYDEKQSVPTQFSRALSELGIELILAGSPQAKGRVERLWGTGQDRIVKELRLADAKTLEEANEVLEREFLPWFNEKCAEKPASPNDAHRKLDKTQNLDAILSIQHERKVSNDYTIRFNNEIYQLLKPALPGQRGGTVIIEQRRTGEMKIRFKNNYLKFEKIDRRPESTAIDESLVSLSNAPLPVVEAKQSSRPGCRNNRAQLRYKGSPGSRVALLQSPVFPTTRSGVA